MSKVGIIAGVAIAAAVGVTIVGSLISAKNYGNAMENSIKATWENNENVLSSGYQQLQGVAGVTKMATEDQVTIFKAAVEGRYGADGSRAVFQMINEQNPRQDPQLYRKVQQVVEATQKDFQANQTKLVEIKRSYQTALGTFWQGMWLGFAGYPKIDLEKYKIISNEGASDAFKSGKQKAPNFGR